ncbi:hypothetical protein COV15_02235 [Candidatus Woesearchaeota archaeon CG10_big_fil_rev_8_21_14_0_10_34_12]|nr:MAG: hypothetical protein COV15_02235 [Candidatus Woesearchaeota archaeon CG10_big_fil_rev_8_21_14_0_10_34_12]
MIFHLYLFLRNFIIIYIICHITLAFILPYFLVPNYFIRYTPEINDAEVQKVLNRLKKIKDQEKFVRAVFDFVIESTYYKNFWIVLYIHRVFLKDIKKIVETEGYLPCNVQNLLLETLLIKSGRFKQEEIKHRYDHINLSVLHQYLVVYVNGKRIELDPWGYRAKKPYGAHAHGLKLSHKENSKLNRFISIREYMGEMTLINRLKEQVKNLLAIKSLTAE